MKLTSITLTRKQLIGNLEEMAHCALESFITGDLDGSMLENFYNLTSLSARDLGIRWNEFCEHDVAEILEDNPEVSDILVYDERTESKIWLGNRNGRFLSE